MYWSNEVGIYKETHFLRKLSDCLAKKRVTLDYEETLSQ